MLTFYQNAQDPRTRKYAFWGDCSSYLESSIFKPLGIGVNDFIRNMMMAPRKSKVNYDSLIDDALQLVNAPSTQLVNQEKLTTKARRAYARTKLETLMERKRLQAEISDDYEYL